MQSKEPRLRGLFGETARAFGHEIPAELMDGIGSVRQGIIPIPVLEKSRRIKTATTAKVPAGPVKEFVIPETFRKGPPKKAKCAAEMPTALKKPVILEIPGSKKTVSISKTRALHPNDKGKEELYPFPAEEKSAPRPPSPEIDPALLVKLPNFKTLNDPSNLDPVFLNLLKEQNRRSPTKELEDIFTATARRFLCEYVLVIANVKYQIIEVELYQQPDPYSILNDSPSQPYDPILQTMFNFYLNNGLYVTLGAPGCIGALHIRSLRRFEDVNPTIEEKAEEKKTISGSKRPGIFEISKAKPKDNRVIEGPVSVLDLILHSSGSANLNDLIIMLNQTPGVNNLDSPIRLGPFEQETTDTVKIYRSPRLNLNMASSSGVSLIHAQYIMKPYRFSTCPHLLKMQKAYWALQSQLDGMSDDDILNVMEVSRETLLNWTTLFLRGETAGLDYFMTEDRAKLLDSKTQIMAFGCLHRSTF